MQASNTWPSIWMAAMRTSSLMLILSLGDFIFIPPCGVLCYWVQYNNKTMKWELKLSKKIKNETPLSQAIML